MEFCKVALTFMSVDMKSLLKYFHGVVFVFKNFTK